MSGVVGIRYLDSRPVTSSSLECMLENLAHRGQDGSGVWIAGATGLGHIMLWTTPESVHEKLPFATGTGAYAITADARIDNREELVERLSPQGDPVSGTITDSALILAAYLEWGEACPEKLIGDFAFAVWDSQRKSLFCARDQAGVKPFYYYLSSTVFAFASEIKALLSLADVPRRLNETRIGEHLAGMVEDKQITFYRDILRLPPAHTLTVGGGGARLRHYWRPDRSLELTLKSDDEYDEAFQELFTESVRCRLRSSSPVGAMLSGGLDSSSITCTAGRILGSTQEFRLPTFSAVFDEVRESDERSFIRAVLAQDRYEPHFFNADKVDPLTSLDGTRWHPDEAASASNIFINLGIYERARSEGVRVLLDGFDGDTTVSHGTAYLGELARGRHWFALSKELKGFSRNFECSFAKLMLEYGWNFGVLPWAPRAGRALEKRGRSLYRKFRPSRDNLTDPRSWRAFLNGEFSSRIGLSERRRDLRAALGSSPLTEREHHYRALTWGVMPYTLEVLDGAAAAFSLELRFPFWDRRLVQFCLSLPPTQKIRRGLTRIILRRSMAGILPEAVRCRGGKSNLAPALSYGLFTFGRETLESVILKDPGIIAEYVDVLALRRAYHRFASGEAMDGDVVGIWRAMSLAVWLKREGLTPLTNGSNFRREPLPAFGAASRAGPGVVHPPALLGLGRGTRTEVDQLPNSSRKEVNL